MRIYGLEEHMANVDVAGAWKRQDPQLTEREAIAFRNWERLVAGIRR